MDDALFSCSARYRTSDNINLPFRVHPVVTEIGKSKIEYKILVKANFSSKLNANNVVLTIPTPLNTAGVTCSVSAGKAKYVPADNSIVWKYVLAMLFSCSPFLL